MKHKRVLIIALTAILYQPLHAGIVVTKDGKAKVGEIKKYKSGAVVVSFRVGKITGKIRYNADDVLWTHSSPKIKSLYDGARAAYAKKEFKIAKLLGNLSLKDPKEADKRAKVKELLLFVKEVGKKAPKKKKDDKKQEPPPPAGTTTADGEIIKVGPKIKLTPDMLENNKIYNAVKGNATFYDGTSIADFDKKQYAAARYYVLIFATLKFAEVRDSVRRMKKHYTDMKADFGDHVEFLLISTDQDKQEWETNYPKLQAPFPALKYDKRSKISGGDGQTFKVVVVESDGTVLASGQREFDAVQTLREKLEDEVN